MTTMFERIHRMNIITTVLAAALVVPALAVGSPLIVSDPDPNSSITHCALYEGTVRTEAAAEVVTGGKRCRFDVATATVGAHTVTAAFVAKDVVWGDQEGPKSAPFVFMRPAKPATAPDALKLAP